MDSKEYKRYHEEHMMHNTGTTVEECLILISTIPLCVFLSQVWCSSIISKTRLFIFEFCIIVLPVILNTTVCSSVNHIVFLNILVLYTSLFLLKVDVSVVKNVLDRRIQRRKAFVSNYRGITNFVSVLCILAVDFTVFPKRFAKTESFGFSLMDLGVGCFVCSNGLVEKHGFVENQFKKLLKTTGVLFFLGMIRVLLVKSVDYHEHVLEYGVHWNFFFTLALCQIISHFVKYLTNYKDPLWLAIMTGLVHEGLLALGFQQWVLSDIPRDSFLSANREGVISCLGYVSLYFAASAIGKYISIKNLTYKKLFIKLLGACALSWIGTGFCCQSILVSRRLVNLGYIFWMLALSLTELVLLLIGEIGVLGTQTQKGTSNVVPVPSILESINKNGLLYFLLGNLLTGLINLLFQTLLLGVTVSMALIIAYMVLLCGAAYILFLKDIVLKF